MPNSAFPIDIVYTWVDGTDPVWLDALHRVQHDFLETKGAIPSWSLASRFQSSDELKYSLRSIEAFAPWVRQVHILTANQCPEWLNTSAAHLVNHTEVFPDEAALPTFSPRSIEAVLHRIPSLAEHFISFNDDFLLGRPARVHDFFLPDGTPLCWGVRDKPSLPVTYAEEDYAAMSAHDAGTRRACQTVSQHFGMRFSCRLKHTPRAMTRSTVHKLWATFPELFQRVITSQFRSCSDVTIPELYCYYLLATEQGVFRQLNGLPKLLSMLAGRPHHLGTSLLSKKFATVSALLRFMKPVTLCFNNSEKAEQKHIDRMLAIYARLFPKPSRFEKA